MMGHELISEREGLGHSRRRRCETHTLTLTEFGQSDFLIAGLDEFDLIDFTPAYETYALGLGGESCGQLTVDPAQLGLDPAQVAQAPNGHIGTATYALGQLQLPQLVLPPLDPASISHLDNGLASPLGLGSACAFDFGDFDETEEVPALELDEAEIVQDTVAPPAPASFILETLIEPVSLGIPPTHLRPNPLPPAAALRAPSPSPAPAPSPAPRATRNAAKPAPVATRTPLPTTSASRPNATGFRGAATKLVALDAPIGHRNYKKDSATSKKRKTTQTQRAMDKRRKAESATPGPSSSASPDELAAEVKAEEGEDEDDVPDDLLSAEERKRRQNTLSARKSRQRKQERLGLLEEENVALKGELEDEQRAHDETRRKLDDAMAILRNLGLA